MMQDWQLSDFKLKIGYWFISNKIFLKRFFLFCLIISDVLLISLSGKRLIKYYTVERVELNKMMSEINLLTIDFKSYREKNKALNLQISELDVISLGNNRYNLIAKVVNPNLKKWVAEDVEYYFYSNGFQSEHKKSFILPGEKKFLTAFNIESDLAIRNPKLLISNIKWKMIKKKDIENFSKKIKEITDFQIKKINFSYLSDLQIKNSGNSINFLVKNNTVYDYYEVGFFIITYNGPMITSANYLQLDDFMAGEEKKAEIVWQQTIPKPSQIIIKPEIDILNKNIIINNNYIGLPK
ncbi:MAG: hypothetical protein U9O66_01705 [Patescibacteria group bacterium]|nr:hypothetical protein [Patescibacteria group bacterium]